MRYTHSLYRSLVGTYFALLLGPFAAAVAGASGLVDPWVSLAVAGLVAGGLGYWVGGRLDVERLATSPRLAVPPLVLPLGYFVWLIALLAHNPGTSPLTLFGRPATIGVLAVVRADDRTVVVTDAGLAVDGESLVVRQRGWFTDVYRLDLPSGPDHEQLQSTFETHAGR